MENRSYGSIIALSGDGELYARYGDSDCFGVALCFVKKENIVLQYSVDEKKPSIVYVYDITSNTFSVVTINNQSLQLQEGVWDLSVEGDRWEGELLNGKPFGFGSYFDSNDHLVYRGCMIDGVRSLFGIIFFGDIHTVEYSGMLLNGRKWGVGIQYDRHQSVLHDGDWIDDSPVYLYDSLTSLQSSSALHTRLRKARLKLLRCTSLHLQRFSVLTSLILESGSCDLLATIQIDAMPSLRSILFDDHSCNSPTANSSLSVQNCPCLESLVFKPSACCFFSSFEIENCPLVRCLSFGGSNFVRARRCSLGSMGCLRDLYFGEGSFMSAMEFELYDLPKLHTVTMGLCAVRGLPEGDDAGSLRLSCSFTFVLSL